MRDMTLGYVKYVKMKGDMSDKRKTGLSKPPVPARPKNLVVLNSKHLPKPPETFSTDNVTNFIKDLNLDVKGEDGDVSRRKVRHTGQIENASSSDLDEDADGYLEVASVPSTNLSESVQGVKKVNGLPYRKKSSYEENSKLSSIFRKVVNRNTGSSETPEVEETKPQISQRPLPLPPVERKSEEDVTSMPWYKAVDREMGVELVRNGVDGYFLLRPSSDADTYLVLTLWYQNRAYNLQIRRRKDGRFALGTHKTDEQHFDSIETMVKYFQSRKLVLYTQGVKAGKTFLTDYPP